MNRPYALSLVTTNDEAYKIAEALGFSEIMEALAVSIFEVDTKTSRIEALYETKKEAVLAKESLNLSSLQDYTINQTADEDWVTLSQKGLSPVEAGRFWVHGSHDADEIPPNIPHPILIDAGLAFGTGHHGTTKGCLIIYDKLLNDGLRPNNILDLGCGAGTLAIAAAMACDTGCSILATDMDNDAVEVTEENAKLNHVNGQIDVALADGFDAPVFKDRHFDLIFANILAGPLMSLAADIVNAMNQNGHVILSGIIDELADQVADRFEQEGLSISPQPSIEGWTSLLGVKA